MRKLWQKDSQGLDPVVEAFETGDDLVMDQKLIAFDIKGSLAHAYMLKKIGILMQKELDVLEKGLNEISQLLKKGKFVLKPGDEDMHTKIELYLTKKYGEVGKKIHTGRSRNDQVLTVIRLFSKEKLLEIEKEVVTLVKELKIFSKKYGAIVMPGYTHMQQAMPSSIKLWIESFEDSLEDDLKFLKTASDLNNQSPLGSAAGYGSPIALDRRYTARHMGFSRVQENFLYCQNSRGKIEGVILAGCISLLQTINKFASDVMVFTTHEFNFFTVSEKVTTGSSIMPQKKNIDIAELLRSKVHLVLGNYIQIISLSSNLMSGYNRDFQDTKKPLIESLEITKESLAVAKILLQNLSPNQHEIKKAMSEEIYAAHKAFDLVKKGVSFRDAYQKVGDVLSKNPKRRR